MNNIAYSLRKGFAQRRLLLPHYFSDCKTKNSFHQKALRYVWESLKVLKFKRKIPKIFI